MNKSKLLLVASLVFMLVLNVLATTLPLNGLSTAEISDSFKVYFVPAGYVFSIWGVIYLTQIWFAYKVLMSKDSKYLDKVLPFYLVSSLTNGLWLVSWHYLQFGVSVVLMLVLLGSLIKIYLINQNEKKKESYKSVPFGIYLGWISVATIANITSFLYHIKWDGFGIAPQVWAMIMIIVAGVLSTLIFRKFRDFAYTLVIIWSLVGIWVKFPDLAEINFGVITALLLIILNVYLIIKKND